MFVKYLYIAAVYGMILPTLLTNGEFTFYWNIPTFACSQRFKLPVLNVSERYGIKQNVGDNFRGDQVSILYDPGWFPAIIENTSFIEITYRNGGVPQAGDLKAHLQKFQRDVDEHIPDKENSGLAIIDFELWRPVYRQNFGKLKPYKELSFKLMKEANPLLSKIEIENEANRLFSEHARIFMTETLELGKQLRPKAKWGYYGLPYCFSGRGNVTEDCEKKIQDENDTTQWLYDSSDVIFPSIYMREEISSSNRQLMVKGRVNEAMRLSLNVDRSETPNVIAYHRYKFPDTLQYLNEDDTVNAIEVAKLTGADGIVLWGAWKDLNTVEKCFEFYGYVELVLGPSIEKFVPISQSLEQPIVEPTKPSIRSSGKSNFADKMCILKLLTLVKLMKLSYEN